MKHLLGGLFLVLLFFSCTKNSRKANDPTPSHVEKNPFFLKTAEISFDRGEFLEGMNRLDSHYRAADGLQRPNGLSLNGRPDFLGIAAWIFDIYLTSRTEGRSIELSWANVVASIQQTDEWRVKHPGVQPVAPPQIAQTNLNRQEFLVAMEQLDELYRSADGLQRPNGLSINGAPDFLGIAAWIFDIYLNRRTNRFAEYDAWQWVIYHIQQSQEWQQKHPGVAPMPQPEVFRGRRPPRRQDLQIILQVAGERPDLLANSCVEQGGNNEFLFEVVRRLRRIPIDGPRYGLNWKRAVIGDMSQDVVSYFYGSGLPTEGSLEVHVIDIINGHCPEPNSGVRPVPVWGDVTVDEGQPSNARWTLQPCPSCR